MRKILFLTFVGLFFVFSFSGCKKHNADREQLHKFVEQINSKANSPLSNGTVLNKCEYKDGDSVLTYYIKVNDNRFDKVNVDSLKKELVKELATPAKMKLVRVLKRNSIGLQYIYDVNGSEFSMLFAPSDLPVEKK
ncbi:MAG: hypothetical protein Q4F85_08095 [Prevotella sp.]|nr:hypothetical protein [Prevotella sp.]